MNTAQHEVSVAGTSDSQKGANEKQRKDALKKLGPKTIRSRVRPSARPLARPSTHPFARKLTCSLAE